MEKTKAEVELQAKAFYDKLELLMEQMAGDKTEHGKREPGERGMYERQNIERARDRYIELGLEVPEGLRTET